MREITAALKEVTEEQFRAGVLAIDPDDYGYPISDDEYQGILAWFNSLREFYVRAATAGRYVLFTADQ